MVRKRGEDWTGPRTISPILAVRSLRRAEGRGREELNAGSGMAHGPAAEEAGGWGRRDGGRAPGFRGECFLELSTERVSEGKLAEALRAQPLCPDMYF